jgi:hypothetical protein
MIHSRLAEERLERERVRLASRDAELRAELVRLAPGVDYRRALIDAGLLVAHELGGPARELAKPDADLPIVGAYRPVRASTTPEEFAVCELVQRDVRWSR